MNVQTTKRPDGFCYACEGYGYTDIPTVDWVPYGSGDVPMYGSEREPCRECVGHNHCPQCGGELVDEGDTSTCLACGHVIDWEHGPDHYRDEHEDDRY